MFLRGCSDHRDQFCLFELKKPPWLSEQSLGLKRFFRWGLIACRQQRGQKGQEMFRGCSRFKRGVMVIHGTAVFIKSVF